MNCLEIARSMECFDRIAFLDDMRSGETICYCPVIGKFEDSKRLREKYDAVFVALGDNQRRQDLLHVVKNYGYGIQFLISPLAHVSKYSYIAKGTVIFPFVSVEPNSSVGEGCVVSTGVVIGHSEEVANFCLIYENAVVRPYAHIGEFSTVGTGSIITMNSRVTDKSVIPEGGIFKVPLSKAEVGQTEEWASSHKSQFGYDPGFF